MPRRVEMPILVRGRKGQRSIADSLVLALASTGSTQAVWPVLSFQELAVVASTDQGYPVRDSTIRSTVYGHPELFEAERVEGKLVWRLTEATRKLVR